jgi:hypothetical protein
VASGRIIVVRESDFSIVGTVTDPLFQGTGRLVLDDNTGTTLYAAMEAGVVVAVDVATPTAPAVLGSLTDAEIVDPVAVMFNFQQVYVASSTNSSISRIHINDPTAMVLDKTLDNANFATTVDIVPLGDGYGAVICPGTTCVVIGTIDGVTATLTDATQFAGAIAADRASAGGVFFVVATTNKTVTAVDASDPYNPVIVDTLTNATAFTSATDLYVEGNFAYITCSTGRVSIVDISDPSNLTLSATYLSAGTIGTAVGIVVIDGVTYIIDSTGRLVSLDFSSAEHVTWDETKFEFDGTFDTDSRVYLQVTGPATVLAMTYDVEDSDNQPDDTASR